MLVFRAERQLYVLTICIQSNVILQQLCHVSPPDTHIHRPTANILDHAGGSIETRKLHKYERWSVLCITARTTQVEHYNTIQNHTNRTICTAEHRITLTGRYAQYRIELH